MSSTPNTNELLIADQILLLCTFMWLLIANYTGLWSNLTRISEVEVLFSTCAEVGMLLGWGGEMGEFCPSAKFLQSYDIYMSAFIHSEIWSG